MNRLNISKIDFFFLVLSALSISSCVKTNKHASRVKIDNGVFVLESGTYMPGVLPLYDKQTKEVYCTATAVSDSTLISAAHCVVEGSDEPVPVEGHPLVSRGPETCVAFPDDSTSCTKNVFFQTSYLSKGKNGRRPDYSADISVLLFPKGTFKYFHALQKDQPLNVGMPVLLAGYSKQNLFSADFPKRWGKNSIQEMCSSGAGNSESCRQRSDADILSIRGSGSFDQVAVSRGDSGGPLFNERCEIVGVASRMVVGGIKSKTSIHIGLAFESNRKFHESLQQAQQAVYCVAGESCQNAEGFVRAITPKLPTNFPCKSIAEDTDPMINDALDKLANNRHNSSDELVDCNFASGACLTYRQVVSADQNKQCDAAFIDLSGHKVLSWTDVPQILPLYDAPDSGAVTNYDRALSKLLDRLETDGASMLEGLRCKPGSVSSDSCCFVPVCKMVSEAGGDMSGQRVDCPKGVETSEASKKWLFNNYQAMPTRLAPDLALLEREVFPCTLPENMALRKTTGICYEHHVSPNPDNQATVVPNAAGGGNGWKKTTECWKVVKGAKTTESLPCPAGL
jgi:hypothetical protein